MNSKLNPMWVSRDGTSKSVDDMDIDHVKNAFNFMVRENKEQPRELLRALLIGAEYMAEQEAKSKRPGNIESRFEEAMIEEMVEQEDYRSHDERI